MTTKDQAIAPCPFCGAGETLIKENGKMWMGMKFSEPASVSIQHWCAPIDGQPNRMVERVGRDMGSAISAWNSRAAQPPAPDCRTCESFAHDDDHPQCKLWDGCTNGDQYKAVPAVVLWRTE